MTIDIDLMIDEEVVGSARYESAVHVPIPDVGEAVVNPHMDGLVVKVCRRIFEYRRDCIRVTLECT